MSMMLKLLGATASGISLFALAHKYFEFGLNPIMSDFVSYYKALFYPIANTMIVALLSLCDALSIPRIRLDQDIMSLYAIVAAARLRSGLQISQRIQKTHWNDESRSTPRLRRFSRVATTALLIVLALLWPLWIVVSLLVPIISGNPRRAVTAVSRFFGSIALALIAFGVFFALNAYGPSL
jgi:hypothetical protein